MYKVGDKVLCKKDFYTFEVGEYYSVIIVSDINYNYLEEFAIHIIDKDGGDWSFDFEKYEGYTYDIFQDYFYTNEEIRKIKLEKLNEIYQ